MSGKQASSTKATATLTRLKAEAQDNVTAPVYFWKPHEEFGFFGQWYSVAMTDLSSGKTFNCCEQYMMYRKAITFKDQRSADVILGSTDPKQQKALGKKVTNFTDEVWDEVKSDIVVDANMLKFKQGKARIDDEFVYPDGPPGQQHENATKVEEVTLKDLLRATGDRELVEASSMDRIWGIGYGAKSAVKTPREKWGKNLLGKALMEVRRRLREEEKEAF